MADTDDKGMQLLVEELAHKGRVIAMLNGDIEQQCVMVREMRAELNSREQRIAELEQERDQLLTRLACYKAGRA